MKEKLFISAFINSILVIIISNSFVLIRHFPSVLYVLLPVFLFICIFAGTLLPPKNGKRLLICQHGIVLLYSLFTAIIISSLYHIVLAIITIPKDYMTLLWSLAICFGVYFLVFWDGVLCVYFTSREMGVKWRVLGILGGLIPGVNLLMLGYILAKTTEEYMFEIEKVILNKKRAAKKLCATKYPILMVHGVFFSDSKRINYWGRIPKELETNGATVFYGLQSPAASIPDSAAELNARVEKIIAETGAEKLNIIAHSKGGLDCRYAIAKLGMGKYVASLTTVNTPHRGCLFADYLLDKIDDKYQRKLTNTYNIAARKLGQKDPDLLAALKDLTDRRCNELNAEMPTPEGIYCQSVGSVLTKAAHGQFPMNFSYHLVKHFDGDNDGLVSESSFRWGEHYILLRPVTKRGISHGDVADFRRENIPGFDVREFYVNLVNGLKNRGL